jgi:hypothetical protein
MRHARQLEECPLCNYSVETDGELSDFSVAVHVWHYHLMKEFRPDIRWCWCDRPMTERNIQTHMMANGGVTQHFIDCRVLGEKGATGHDQ